MIEIKNLSKAYKKQIVLDNVNMHFCKCGLYFILGPSGCGKTTLINAISGLIQFSGEIIIDGINTKTLNDDKLSQFRLENIGYVFQDFKLFNNEKVYDNVLLPLLCIKNKSHKRILKRADDILKLIGIYDLKDKYVGQLSGGQKQMVAISRSLINDIKILLCDEPTGSLDVKNKHLIMQILKRLSSSILVIVISHDKDLAMEYGDYIYEFKEKNFVLTKKINDEVKKKSLPIFKSKLIKQKGKLPLRFLFSHSKNCIKKRPFRSFIVNFVISFGFLSVGMSLLLSDAIYSSVLGVYGNIITDNQIIVTSKDYAIFDYNIKSINQNEAKEICFSYEKDISNYGICYLANFEEYFKDLNRLVLANTTYRYVLRGYSIRHINDFIWIDDLNSKVYPNFKSDLKDDEIIIALDPFMVSEICYQLRIERTIQSLSSYIKKNSLPVCFELANYSWQYYDEQLFNIVGFIISNQPAIYHSNYLFNEQVYEKQMRFPINSDISVEEYYPWILKKCYYLKTLQQNEIFLKKCIKDPNLSSYLFEVANQNYYPWLYNQTNSRDIDRIIVFYNPFKSFNFLDYDKFKFKFPDIYNPIYSTNGGYSIYGTSLLSGFTNMLFLSASQTLLDETTGVFASNDFQADSMVELPKGVVWGHYSKTSLDGVFFNTLDNINFYDGSFPKSYSQFVISTGLAQKLFNSLQIINKPIYLSIASNSNGNYFTSETFTIVGLVNDTRNIIYHDDLFSILFFQTQLGISCFDLVPVGMSFNVLNNNSQLVINELKSQFQNYDFINPMYDIKKETDQLCFYLEIILWSLSFLTMIVSICLVGICNYLHLLDIKKDIGLLRCLGISKKESLKLLFSHSIYIAIIGVLSSSLQLILFYFAFKYIFDNLFNITLNLPFSLTPYFLMFLFALAIGFISASFFVKKVKKLNTIECLKNY